MILDGKKVSLNILEQVSERVEKMDKKPHLVVIIVGNNPASKIYVKNKQLAAEKVGIRTTIIEFFRNNF